MIKMNIRWLALPLLLALLVSATAATASKPNFSGVWKFNAARSKMQIPAPTSATFRIDHREPLFHLSRTLVRGGQSDSWGIELASDGREVVQQDGGETLRGRLYWDGEELVFDSRIILKDREASNVVRYRLSDDGRTLTASESFRGPVLKYDNVWVFDKE